MAACLLGLAIILILLLPPLPALAHAPAAILVVPYRGQLDGSPTASSNCGPASLAMVLAGYNQDIPIADLRARVNDLQGSWGDPQAGTAIENLASIARHYGLVPLDLMTGERRRRWTLEDLRRHLDAGHPVIPQVWYRGLTGRAGQTYNGDHYIVMVGYDGDEFLYHDPIDLSGIGPLARISAAQLMVAWDESDLPFAALALAGPATQPSLIPTPTLPPTARPDPTATLLPPATPHPTAPPSPMPSATPSPSPTFLPSPTASPIMVSAPTGRSRPGGKSQARTLISPSPWPPVAAGPGLLVLVVLAIHQGVMIGRLPPVVAPIRVTGGRAGDARPTRRQHGGQPAVPVRRAAPVVPHP